MDNGLSAHYLLNEWMDFDQTCTAILLRQRQELIIFFVTLMPFSRSHKGYDFRKWLVSTLSHSRLRWLSWMCRPTGDQEVAGSTPAEVGNILSWRLIMKYFLRSFTPFC